MFVTNLKITLDCPNSQIFFLRMLGLNTLMVERLERTNRSNESLKRCTKLKSVVSETQILFQRN